MSRIKPYILLSRTEEFMLASESELIYQLRAEEEDYPVNSIQREGLTAILAAATEWLEDYTGHIFVDSQVQFFFDKFPSGAINLPIYPARELVDVFYQDVEGLTQQMPAEDIDYDFKALQPFIVPVNSWPAARNRLNAVSITINVGSATAEGLPKKAKIACLMLAAHLHQNSSATSVVKLEQVPMGVIAMANMLRVAWL